MTDVQGKLDAIVAMIEQAKTKPLSGAVVIPRADLLAALSELREVLPAQLSEAEKVLRERRSLVEAARTEAERLLADARRQSERTLEDARRNSDRMLESARAERQSLLDESSILAEAEADAEQLVADARAEVARMRAETDDYVDASLARFEALLEHTLATVGRGRDKLRALSDTAWESTAGAGGPSVAPDGSMQPELPDPEDSGSLPPAGPIDLTDPAPENADPVDDDQRLTDPALAR
jgi:cell division septum initiation protein DivIVA